MITIKKLLTISILSYLMLSSLPLMAQMSSVTQAPPAPSNPFGLSLTISRSTSLIDRQDGSLTQSWDFTINPSLKTSFGTFAGEVAYSENLKNNEDSANGLTDFTLAFITPSYEIHNQDDSILKWTNSITSILPMSEISLKRAELRTALIYSTGLNWTMGSFNLKGSVSAGRNFHNAETDINNNVLNQYSSNQNIAASYAISDFTLSGSYTNRTRWTYQNNIRQSFIHSQEVSYQYSETVSLAMGHTNEALALKADGATSNVQIIDEDSSIIYGSIGVSF